MLSNFSAKMVAATSILGLVRAQMPHECFFVTDMIHTLGEDKTDFVSDLPDLMAEYKPGMRLAKITAFGDVDYQDLVTGIETTLYDPSTREMVNFPVVGFRPENWDETVVNVASNPIDRISITKNDEGICDVTLWEGHKPTYLSGDYVDCTAEEDGGQLFSYRITEETPLVGFHGRTDGLTLTALGLIFVDTTTPACLRVHDNIYQDYYEEAPLYEVSEASEHLLTADEK